MSKISICFISDTHNQHKKIKELPDADVIVHSGDFTSMGHEHEIRNFFKWFSNLNQYKYKIIIAGNHDLLFEKNSSLAKTLIPDNVTYLEDSGIILNGIYFYGSPVSLPFFNWAFNRSEEKLKKHWEAIPDDVDILITHTPPYKIRDFAKFGTKTHCGSKSLYNEIIERIKPLISTFGHIHSGYGITDINNIKFINASMLNDSYIYKNKPILVEINNNIVNIITE
jgi:Icc-related predicted phosphoesterase